MTIYHFVGIKGSGMSALAQVLHDMNFDVQGSDVEKRFSFQDRSANPNDRAEGTDQNRQAGNK